MSAESNIDFSFTWRALELLGQGLYSNAWSALSELVANGLDAGAEAVFVYIDARDKQNATIEVFDSGRGMSMVDLERYVKVGHDKRTDEVDSQYEYRNPPMGRKGIGKLAVLYLSNDVHIRTKTLAGHSSWLLKNPGDAARDDVPSLIPLEDGAPSRCLNVWQQLRTGTLLTMNNVNLTGYGDEAINALSRRLANQFVLSSMEKPQRVLVFVDKESGRPSIEDFVDVRKGVAFWNLAGVKKFYSRPESCPSELRSASHEVLIPPKQKGLENHRELRKVESFDIGSILQDALVGMAPGAVNVEDCTYLGKKISLEGWIGFHATINKQVAQINDERFSKNRFYNPNQIRVYVRNKLATEDLLSQLGLTASYVNYIEGEVSFNLLDEDGLPDIATSNRQDFNDHDDRVILLRNLVRLIVQQLMRDRSDMMQHLDELEGISREEKRRAGKKVFSDQFGRELASFSQIDPATREEIRSLAVKKIRGSVEAKNQFRVFISHASKDKIFTDFIYYLLRSRGASDQEIFYTSSETATDLYGSIDPLPEVLRENICDVNSQMLYFMSRNFMDSSYCLFEGGAGWATRGIGDILRIGVEYSDIPEMLSMLRPEHPLMAGGKVELTPKTHNYLIEYVLNPIIRHLNEGRSVSGGVALLPFQSGAFPTPLEMGRAGVSYRDFYDSDVLEHWKSYIEPGLSTYLDGYKI